MKLILISQKYNYNTKALKAMEEGNIKYIDSLIKRGKMVVIDDEDLIKGDIIVFNPHSCCRI